MTQSARVRDVRTAFQCGIGVVFLLACADFLGLPGGASLGHVAMLACMPFWANAAMARRTSVFAPNAASAVMLILMLAFGLTVWTLVSTVNAAEPLRVGRALLSLLASFAMFSFVVGTITDARIKTVFLAIALALAGVSLLSVIGYVNPLVGAMVYGDSDRASGTFKNPNQLGIVLATAIPVTCALVLSTIGRTRVIAGLCLLLMIVGLLLSGSKTNLVLSVATLSGLIFVVIIVTFSGRTRFLLLMAALVGTAAVAVGGFLALQYLNPRAVRLLLTFVGDGSIPSVLARQQLWLQSFEIFTTHPIVGEGAGQKLLVNVGGKQISHSHNILIEYARTLGAPGLFGIAIICFTVLLFAAGTIIAIMAGRPGDNPTRILTVGAAISSMVYVVANATSESFGPSTSVFFWLILALFFALHRQLFPGARRVRANSPQEAVV